MRAPLVVVIVGLVGLLAATARAEHALCSPGARFRGAPIDLDVKDADVRDVLRLVSDVGHVNLVIGDDIAGKVTLRLKRVPWDQVACAVAALQHLRITVQDTILLVTRADAPR